MAREDITAGGHCFSRAAAGMEFASTIMARRCWRVIDGELLHAAMINFNTYPISRRDEACADEAGADYRRRPDDHLLRQWRFKPGTR